MVSLAPHVVRVHLQVLCNFHTPVLRAGEERIRAAMAEYAQTILDGTDSGLPRPRCHVAQ